MKLWEIFRYDFTSQLRRYMTGLYCVGLGVMTLLAASTFFDDVVRDGILLNAPMVTTACLIVVSMIGLLVTAALAGEAATRDIDARMEPLLYTTPLAKATYLGGRFLSAFAVNALLLAIVPVTLAVWTFVPIGEAASFGPFHLAPYLRSYGLVALPTAFITTALLFSLVVLTRRAMVGYLGAAVLFFNTIVQEGVVAGALGKWELAKRLDVFGFIIGAAQWRSRTPLQRNTMQLELEGALLANRAIWLTVAIVALLLVYMRFRMAHYASTGGWRWRRRAEAAAVEAETKPWTIAINPSRIRGRFDGPTRVRQTLAIALRSFREMLTSRAAVIIPAMVWLVYGVVPELLEFGLGTPGRPSTGRMALLYGRFNVSGIAVGALVAFFAGQLVWRERDAREHDIADATPVPDAVSLIGKFGGLVLLLLTMQTLLIATGIVTQFTSGYYDFEPMLWVRVLLGMKMADYLLFAALAMAVQVVVNQKYVATAIVMLAWVFPEFASGLGIQHNLLIYGADPGLTYSDLSGFAGSFGPWLWFKLYWAGWALTFALLARLFWVRGHNARTLTLARQRFTRIPIAIAVAALGLIVVVGGFVFYNTNVLNEYLTDDEATKRSVDYERRYGRYADLAQPLVAAMKLHLELHPAQRIVDIRGTYRLENRSGRAIEAIHLVTRRTSPATGVTFDRPARATHADRDLGYSIYTLGTPLAPGQSLRMNFETRLASHGFGNSGITPAVTGNGTFLEHRPDGGGRTWLPAVGYRRGVELDSPRERRAFGLPARPALPPLQDAVARNEERGLEHIELETVIGTDADQIAIAPGALRRSWNAGGRRYFHYVTDSPIRNGFPILSARYAVHRSKWNDVDIEVVYHPKHVWNVERIARSARASLDNYARDFGPYPQRQLRLVEFPITGGNRLTGHPGTVVWSEALAFAQPEADWREVDFPFAVVAHEVAHQWWGNQVVPARVEGAPLVSESLAWYSAMNVVEENLGREHLGRLLQIMRDSYLVPHQTAEVPLLKANDWLAVYRTGALAMHSLRDAIGKERVNGALHGLVEEYRSGKPPFPTSLDLYRHLRSATPPESRLLLKELFEEITFWDLRMKTIRAERAGGGTYRVTLGVEAYKVKVGTAGRETRVPMNDDIEVTVFAAPKAGEARGATLYRQRHRIHAGEQTIVVTVPSAPATAGIDPDYKLLDRKREDNVKDFEGMTPSAR
ncbi:MAG TPA: ABC transporter permease [Thermoanaerobaculia bacterium]